MTPRDCACGSAPRGSRSWRIAALCVALLIALAPSLHAFAMAPLENPAHTAWRAAGLASPAGDEAAAVSTRVHQHGDEILAIGDGVPDCSILQSTDSCMPVCCVAILSQSLEHTRVPLARETESFLTIPSSASRIASHPPPEAIA